MHSFMACDHCENTCWDSIMYFIEAQAQYKKQKQMKSHDNIVQKKVRLTSQNKKYYQF